MGPVNVALTVYIKIVGANSNLVTTELAINYVHRSEQELFRETPDYYFASGGLIVALLIMQIFKCNYNSHV